MTRRSPLWWWIVAGSAQALPGKGRREVAGTGGASDGVVGALPCSKGLVEWTDVHIAVVELGELFGMGPLGSLDVAVELGGPGWEHEESDASLLAGPLEPSLELRSAVLPRWKDGGDGEGHTFQEPVQEACRRDSGVAAVPRTERQPTDSSPD